MLRIRRDEIEDGQVVLVLHGHIVGEWAALLERECSASIQSGLQVVLDLAEVTFVGHSALAVLGRLDRAGVDIRGCSLLIADTLEHEGIEVGRAVPKRGGVPDG